MLEVCLPMFHQWKKVLLRPFFDFLRRIWMPKLHVQKIFWQEPRLIGEFWPKIGEFRLFFNDFSPKFTEMDSKINRWKSVKEIFSVNRLTGYRFLPLGRRKVGQKENKNRGEMNKKSPLRKQNDSWIVMIFYDIALCRRKKTLSIESNKILFEKCFLDDRQKKTNPSNELEKRESIQ